MNDLDLIIAGAMVSFLSVAGAYIAIRHRANETPVSSYARKEPSPAIAPRARENLNPR
ncbi:MAG: hypothetical protein OER77_11855 [Myxococcales bacterium]|nr:hypothetical protein [Myxococcales bacterium]